MMIYLIRHGKTEANARRLYCGSTDLPLSEEGIRQLQHIHYDIPKARFLSSGMRRANETLELLFPNTAYETDPRFREVDFGIFEMHSYEHVKQWSSYQTWITGDNDANIPPEGESGNQMRRRVIEALSEIREDTVLVSHGGVIAAIMEHLFPEEEKNRYEWQPGNGCGYMISGRTYKAIP